MEKKLLSLTFEYSYFKSIFNYTRKGLWKGTLICQNCHTLMCFHLEKKGVWKKTKTIHYQGLSAFNMQKQFLFVSNFEHVNFAINEKYFKNIMTIQTIMFHLWSFKHTKMQF